MIFLASSSSSILMRSSAHRQQLLDEQPKPVKHCKCECQRRSAPKCREVHGCNDFVHLWRRTGLQKQNLPPILQVQKNLQTPGLRKAGSHSFTSLSLSLLLRSPRPLSLSSLSFSLSLSLSLTQHILIASGATYLSIFLQDTSHCVIIMSYPLIIKNLGLTVSCLLDTLKYSV